MVATLGDADLEGGGQLRMKTFGDHIDAACDSVTVEATVTLGGGTYVLRAGATVGIARFETFALSAQLYPAPIDPAEGISFDGGARPLKLVHCSGKYERARLFVATAIREPLRARPTTKAVDLRLVTLSEDSGGATLKSAILNVPGPRRRRRRRRRRRLANHRRREYERNFGTAVASVTLRVSDEVVHRSRRAIGHPRTVSGVAGTSPATISVFRVRFMGPSYANYDGALAAKTGVGIDELFVFSVAQDTIHT